jgi:hypothetical protein
MGKIGLAFQTFFKVLFQREAAQQVEELFRDGTLPKSDTPRVEKLPAATPPATPKKPIRSEALTLLATLQREARFLDLIQEPLSQYEDAQVGAAARDVLRGCSDVLQRLFEIKPVTNDSEGSPIEVPAGFDAGVYRLTGNVTGEAPFRGTLTHHGWQATRCQMPEWSGSKQAAMILAPAEVELK